VSGDPPAPPANTGALFFAILESLPFRVYAYDLDGRCILQNSVSLRDFGSMVGRHVSEAPLERVAIERWLVERQRALAGEVVWGELQSTIRGDLHIFQYAIAPFWSDGKITGTVGIDIDITDQRRTEKAMQDLRQKLHDREAQLAHLDRVSTLGQMASEVAHELSQPLYAISNFADACLALLQQPGELNRADLKRWLEQIAGQARRGGDCLKRMTRYVRKGELVRERLDLNDRIRDCLAMLQIELSRHQVQVRTELASAPLWTRADALLIEQVLVNLIRNAAQAMDQVPPEQRVLTVSSSAIDGEVGASVSDTGPGLATDKPNQLFEPYLTTKPHGTGLGLAICRSTIEAHGGRIWADSIPSGGALFRFTLPAATQ
jgi:C4-dicarboxylate-specific signal transduction histidine kinase